MWERLWPTLLGTDRPDPAAVARILVGDVYQPDSFTVAERLAGPAWLDPAERDGEAWLAGLVARRLPPAARTLVDGHGQLGDLAAHVLGEVRRVLDYRHGDAPVAESLWNQEVPYLVDRVIGWCLFGDANVSNDIAKGFNRDGLRFLTRFLHRVGHRLDRLDSAQLFRMAVAAGLLGLDRKGGPAPFRPIFLPRGNPTTERYQSQLTWIWNAIRNHADAIEPVDHLDALLDMAATGPVRMVWWLDDLIETGFDLITIQQLMTVNPRLHVTVVPKNGRYDNDASTSDVVRLLTLAPFAQLGTEIGDGRLVVSDRGPRMATANPTKLHPWLIEAIRSCDVMVCKGGRIHEMFAGNVNTPMFTAYVAVRPFTESQCGLDATDAPLVIFGAEVGEWPWWGFHGRADRRITLASERTIPACHTTVAEHDHRKRTADPLALGDDLAHLVGIWPHVAARYGHAARAELRLVHDRLRPHTPVLPPATRHLLPAAAEIIGSGRHTHGTDTDGEPAHVR
ncbi:ARMT1-like domain-containing protein [Virgisporangium aurantiacum]|uniref:Damage-control phosphatase ARMT1-like metal-binding domain-containing protein n=1 Tax=Virgisporangium aurantiacum TaxID=175570 RepID=A0A8J3ZFC1_9ACTN|nr:ARMT1-like domain-containing protein [Virgisporangium aurantiacum]GIJ63109.1 hypothetical protein Vau01_106250 [Virgisporangium aurantiacum]